MIQSTDYSDARVAVPMWTDAQPRVRFAAIRLVGIRPFYPGGRVR